MSKKMKIVTLIIVAALVLLAICLYGYKNTNSDLGEYIDDVQMKELSKKEDLPDGYEYAADKQGSLETVEYSVVAKGEELTKKATVYIPYGYDSSREYDVVYLVHGRGGKYNTWLGTAEEPKTFKNILDNMIQNGDIRPIIVVTPGLTYAYGDKNTKARDEASDIAVVKGTADEICDKLIPLVSSKYSTKTDRTGMCVAGFSMGGSLTWRMLLDHTDKFYYYIPMSMALYFDNNGYSKQKSLNAVKMIDEKLRLGGYGVEDFKVYTATGDSDHKALAGYMMTKDLVENSSCFKYADSDYKDGNIYMNIWSGRWHSYKESYPYMYNGLKKFFKPQA